ncbi:MAG TPA: class IV adenylate cyclase [Balneolales bacterium]|nr:class IV adenylate cyclase [Balneolales bacterium]
MEHINIEIKARCSDPAKIRSVLKNKDARFMGSDHQIDTYFKSTNGRLKLRQGTIENNLIHYNRSDQKGPKQSEVSLYPVVEDSDSLRQLLAKAVGILKVVDKRREIYFIDNVKFHIDTVNDLGNFVEIEAIDTEGHKNVDQLRKQCAYYLKLFQIEKADLLTGSYSDMV